MHIAILVNKGNVPAFVNICIEQIKIIADVKVSIIEIEGNAHKLSTLEYLINLITFPPKITALEKLNYNVDYTRQSVLPDFNIALNLSNSSNFLELLGNTPVLSVSLFKNGVTGFFSEIAAALSEKKRFFTIQLYTQDNSVISEGNFKTVLHSYKSTLQSLINNSIALIKETIIKFPFSSNEIITNTTFNISVSHFSSLKYLKACLSSLIKQRFNNLFASAKWNIGIVNNQIEDVVFSTNNYSPHWLKEADGNDFKADPFGIINNRKLFILYEYFDAKKGKGILKINEELKEDVTLFESTKHMSYPSLFEFDNQWYCIPEQFQLNNIDLYKFIPHTKSLVFHKTIIKDFEGVDPSIIYFNSKFWLFCTNASNKGADLRLHIFYADHPDGPWNSHNLNPVKTDICSARPAGNPFLYNGKLYRPSQDSSYGYGSCIVINEIINLSTTQFEEKAIKRITAGQFGNIYPDGIHTISFCGPYTLIDGKRIEYKLRNCFKFFFNN